MSTHKFYDGLNIDPNGSSLKKYTHSEARIPQIRLALKRQLIELREEKSNYDYLFSKLNNLQHKFRLLEEEFSKNRQFFSQNQKESENILNQADADIRDLQIKTELKEKELKKIKQIYEKMMMKANEYESQIKENIQLQAFEESKAMKEGAEMGQEIMRKSENEEERSILSKKLEQLTEEVEEIENQLIYYRGVSANISENTNHVHLEIKTSENKRESLEVNVGKLKDDLESKIQKTNKASEKLDAKNRIIQSLNSENKISKDNIKKLEKEDFECERRQAEGEDKISCLEKMKMEFLNDKDAKDIEIIEQTKKLKIMDFEIQTLEEKVKSNYENYESINQFQDKLLKCLSLFEEENSEIHRMVSNSNEILDAMATFRGNIDEAKKCLMDI
jgi:hypothetical protein